MVRLRRMLAAALLCGLLAAPASTAAVDDSADSDAFDVAPVPVRTVTPDYPAAAREAGREGQTVVKIVIDREGKVADGAIDVSSGEADFDEAALKAAWQWEFEPARKDGAAVEAEVRLPFRFALKDGS